MSGTINNNSDKHLTNFRDGDCSVNIKRVENFVSLINLEEVKILGNSTSHADLALIHKSENHKVTIFELKGVNDLLESKELKKLQNKIKGKLRPTVELFLGKKGKQSLSLLNEVFGLNQNINFEFVIVFKKCNDQLAFLGVLTEKVLKVKIDANKQFNIPVSVILEEDIFFPQ